jgi:hypothetical protein
MLEARELGEEGRRGRPGPRGPRRLAPRLLLPTDRADLRISWHADDDVFVLTLWHGDVCVGSAPLSPPDAAEVASFLVGQLGARASAVTTVDPTLTTRAPSGRTSPGGKARPGQVATNTVVREPVVEWLRRRLASLWP